MVSGALKTYMESAKPVTVVQREASYGEVMDVLGRVDTLESVNPFEFSASEVWVVLDDNTTVGMALVEQKGDVAWVHRIGVLDERQGEGLGRALIENIREEYGVVELEVRDSKDANGFYEYLGMELTEERYAVFNDDTEGTLNVWRWG